MQRNKIKNTLRRSLLDIDNLILYLIYQISMTIMFIRGAEIIRNLILNKGSVVCCIESILQSGTFIYLSSAEIKNHISISKIKGFV